MRCALLLHTNVCLKPAWLLTIIGTYVLDCFVCAGDGSETDENALLDFDTTSLIREMESYQKGDMVMERAREVLARSDFSFKDKIKSRVKGTLLCLHCLLVVHLFS